MDSYKKKLELYRKKILDTSKRNPLISFKLREDSISYVRFVDEIPDSILSKLNDDKELILEPIKDPNEPPKEELKPEFISALSKEKNRNEKYWEARSIENENSKIVRQMEFEMINKIRRKFGFPPRHYQENQSEKDVARRYGININFELSHGFENELITKRHSDNKLQTLLFKKQMYNKLSKLYKKVDFIKKETGINSLYIIYGFLEWIDEQEIDKKIYSPLVLQEVEIFQKSSKGEIVFGIRAIGDNPIANPVLALRLKEDYKMILPEFKVEDTIQSYNKVIEKIISPRHQWKLRNSLTLSLLSFSKFLIYKDLDPAILEKLAIPEHALFFNFLDKKLIEDNIDEEFNADALMLQNRLPLIITNADSSQYEAIDYVVSQGKSTIIQGPPGTGKSQTITNIIAASIFSGKRVLFLSEKLAALKVVKNRLTNAGIGEFCLELHSNKVNKSEVFQTLKNRYELKEKKINQNYSNHLDNFKSVLLELNEYYEKIKSQYFNFKKPFSAIIWGAIQIAEEINYDPNKNVFINIPNIKKITNDDLAQIKKELKVYKELSNRLIKRYGSVDNHNWSYLSSTKGNEDFSDKLLEKLLDILSQYETLIEFLTNKEYWKLSINSLKSIYEVVEVLEKIQINFPKVDKKLLKEITNENILSDIKQLKAILEKRITQISEAKSFNCNYDFDKTDDINSKLNVLIVHFKELTIDEASLVTKFFEELYHSNDSQICLELKDFENLRKILRRCENIDVTPILETIEKQNELLQYIKKNFLYTVNIEQLKFVDENLINFPKLKSLDEAQLFELWIKLQKVQKEISVVSDIFNKTENDFQILPKKIDRDILNDLENINKLLNSFPESAKSIEKREYCREDLNDLTKMSSKKTKLVEGYLKLSKSLHLSLFNFTPEQTLSWIIRTKSLRFYSIFGKSYWQLNKFKKTFLIKKMSNTSFVELLEEYYNLKETEESLKEDFRKRKFSDNMNDILNFDFTPHLELANWNVEVQSISLRSQLSTQIINSIVICNHQRFNFINYNLNLCNTNELRNLTHEMENNGFSNLFSFEDNVNNQLVYVTKCLDIIKTCGLNSSTTLRDFQKVIKLLPEFYNYSEDSLKILKEFMESNMKFKDSLDYLAKLMSGNEVLIKKLHNFVFEYLKTSEEIKKHSTSNLLTIKNFDAVSKENISYLDDIFIFFDLINKLRVYPELFAQLITNILENNIISTIKEASSVRTQIVEILNSFLGLHSKGLFEFYNAFQSESVSEVHLEKLIEYCNWMQTNIKYYPLWNDYQYCYNKLKAQEVTAFLKYFNKQKLDINYIEKYFELFVYMTLTKEILGTDFSKSRWNGKRLEELKEEFRELDKNHLQLNSIRIRNELIKNRLNLFNLFLNDNSTYKGKSKHVSEKTGEELIYNEINKSRRHIPIRNLFERAAWETTSFCPCLMMSPLTVAQYLPADLIKFDILLIDEASQLRPEYCLSAILRSKEIVVVGDSNQLPPTTFFDKTIDETFEVIDDEIFEGESIDDSILELSNGMFKNKKYLNWHYRSKHESLIQFSNREFYDDKLIIFPSSKCDNEFGVKYNLIEDAVYVPKISKNYKEAEAIARKVIELAESDCKESFGVVTMNDSQRELIEREIDKLIEMSGNSNLSEKLYGNDDEEFFVKNLENVQGDERDIIIISTVYGKDQVGNFYQRFGPINSVNGHKRLNVLFTRARKQVLLYTSMKPEDIDERGKQRGVGILKRYLEYARDGIMQFANKTNGLEENEFELAVKGFLTAHGFEVESQIGVNGFFIDLGVKNPNSNNYILGIECDGAPYHSSKSARDRDKLRQEILENLGWKIYRIWSTDWYRNYDAEKKKLLTFLKNLKENS